MKNRYAAYNRKASVAAAAILVSALGGYLALSSRSTAAPRQVSSAPPSLGARCRAPKPSTGGGGGGVVGLDGGTVQGSQGVFGGIDAGAEQVGSLVISGAATALTFTDQNARIVLASTNFLLEKGSTGHFLSTGGYESSSFSLGSLGTANPFATAGAPTIGSGFGSGPSVVANDGTIAFLVDVGSGGTASSGIVSFPLSAATGWFCDCRDLTTPSSTTKPFMTANSTSGCTMTNQTVSTGSAIAFASHAQLWCLAVPL